MVRNYEDEARQSFKKAIALDPEFAAAYIHLAEVTEGKEMIEALEKAKAYSGKAPEKIRLYIQYQCVSIIDKDWDKSFRLLEELVAKYPSEKIFRHLLAVFSWRRGDTDRGIAEFQKGLALDPAFGASANQLGILYAERDEYEKAFALLEKFPSRAGGDANIVDTAAAVYFKAGRLDDALARYKDALEIKPNWYTPQMGMAWVHGLKEDYGEALRSLDQYLEGDHSHKWQGHFAKSFFLSWLGRWREVDDELQKMKDVMEGPEGGGNKWLPMLYLILRANVDLEKGDLGKARKDVQDWRDYREKTWPDRADPDYIFMTGWLEFKEGRIAEAKAVLDKYTSYLTESKTERIRQSRFWSALLDSEILLAEGSPERAIEIFRQAPSIGRMENSENTVGSAVAYNFPYLKDVAARAYIKMGEVGKAIAEYERLTAFDPKQPERRLIHPLYYYRLAKLYEQKGNRGKARARYERFLELWKDAEPGQPEVDDARARLAALI